MRSVEKMFNKDGKFHSLLTPQRPRQKQSSSGHIMVTTHNFDHNSFRHTLRANTTLIRFCGCGWQWYESTFWLLSPWQFGARYLTCQLLIFVYTDTRACTTITVGLCSPVRRTSVFCLSRGGWALVLVAAETKTITTCRTRMTSFIRRDGDRDGDKQSTASFCFLMLSNVKPSPNMIYTHTHTFQCFMHCAFTLATAERTHSRTHSYTW